MIVLLLLIAAAMLTNAYYLQCVKDEVRSQLGPGHRRKRHLDAAEWRTEIMGSEERARRHIRLLFDCERLGRSSILRETPRLNVDMRICDLGRRIESDRRGDGFREAPRSPKLRETIVEASAGQCQIVVRVIARV
ncbi:MAG: hypothetical protein ACR2PG_22130 [Hyphomicrobiaceae bacterium]